MTEVTAPDNKISASHILSKIDDLQRDVTRLRAQAIELQDLRFFRPSSKDLATGKALKLDLNLRPKYDDDGYVAEVGGGCFLDIVPQKTLRTPTVAATFDWGSAGRVSAKLGPPDIAGFLIGIEARWLRFALPEKMGAVAFETTERGVRLKLFHKNKDGNTTIGYTFNADSGYLELSKQVAGVVTRKDFILTLAEEWQFKRYLERALDSYASVGKR